MDSTLFNINILIGPQVLGNMFSSVYLDIVVLYNINGGIVDIRANEKFGKS